MTDPVGGSSSSSLPGNVSSDATDSGAAAILIAEATLNGDVDTRQLASAIAGMTEEDPKRGKQEYDEIETILSRRSPMLAAQFSRDVDALLTPKASEGAAPPKTSGSGVGS